MNAEYGDRLREGFDQALELPEGQRVEFVRSRYADDEELCRELLGMLGHVGASDSFLQPLESEAVRSLLGTARRPKKPKPPPLPDLEGRRLADRYVVGAKLGEGGSGVVYAGVDRLSDKAVAVKVLRHAREGARQDLRREAAALRLLRLPGIVQLLDEGVEDDLVYLVTELVDGAPFPAHEGALGWDDLADVTTAFLETVERMHRAGIVHGDLKPGNVLVRRDGVPVILDLGIAQGPRAGVADRKRRGTFRYVAPEQLKQGVATPRADLYAVGVMLYEALTGEPYRSEPTVALTRLGVVTDRPSKSLAEAEADVPDTVREVVNRLLAKEAEDRPESARDVLAALAPTDAAVAARRDVPFVGRVALLEAVLAAAREARPLDLWGPPGSGRTRLLEEAAAVLAGEGVDVVWLDAAGVPRAAGDRDAVLLADDADALPQAVHDLTGAVVRVGSAPREGAIEVPPLEADALRALFAGGDRLHHIPEDAAVQLWRRTGGRPGRLVPELDAWSRAGLGWWDGGRYHLRRLDIDQLQRGVRAFSPRPAPPAPDAGLSAVQRRLLFAIELAGPRAEVPLLASALEIPQAEIEQLSDELEDLGVLDRTPGGTWEVLSLPGDATELHASLGPDLHARLARALPLGDERRLMHTVAAGRHEDVPVESIAAARALFREGDAEGARTAIAEGLGALPVHPDPEATRELLALQVQTALQMGTKPALDEALHRLGCYPPNEALERLEQLCRAVMHGLDGQPARAMEELPSLEGVTDEDEVRRVVSARLFMARFLGEAALESEVEVAERLATEIGSSVIGAAAASARAWLLYERGEYADSGDLHLQAARAAPNAVTRTSSLLNAASAYLDGGDLDRAGGLAGEALSFARTRRHALLEARAEFIVRAAAYRRGDVLEPDLPLAMASRELGAPQVAALIDLNEAAIAWRSGRLVAARQLAADATRIWQGDRTRWERLLANALLAAAGSSGTGDRAFELIDECRECPHPRMAIQAAWLLGQADGRVAETCRSLVNSLAAGVPPEEHARPLEIVSIADAMK